MSEQTPRKCDGHRFGHQPIDCPREAKYLAVLPGGRNMPDRYRGESHELCGVCVRGYRKSLIWNVTPLT